MELKEYQADALAQFGHWLHALAAARIESETTVSAVSDIGVTPTVEMRDYPRKAWGLLAAEGGVPYPADGYVPRTDDADRPIPHICFKVPTGGGKTLLAAAALERLNRQTGLTLWLVPTKAIYEQTKQALWNREHPYRQMLERASGGRVKMLEKDDQFSRADVAHYLCVMLVMLPAANRQKGKEFLKMFRDSGRYPTLFPDEDDILGDGKLLAEYPDLERIDPADQRSPIKRSLFNVLKMLRPVVILDEAHKAYGAKKKGANEEFVRSVNRLDPSMVIELSATPNRGISNLLVDIDGPALKAEEMIKLPVQVATLPNAHWKDTLRLSKDELDEIEADAKSLQQNEGRYIRPIAVVRVERTGKDQRDGEHVHAEDVREYLTGTLGVPTEAVRVKSAQQDELAGEDLLSEYSEVRWIITKAALMEGWDCPFAYMLVILDNTTAQRAITQLVGRVMRQPHARHTGRERLDQCYVYCWNTDVGKAVEQVRAGLEQAGLTGLGSDVTSDDPGERKAITIHRRERYRGREIFLPRVSHRDGDDWVELDYYKHILPAVDWHSIGPALIQSSYERPRGLETATVDLGELPPEFHADQEVEVDRSFKASWYARRLADLVPNAWQAARIAREMADWLMEQHGQAEEHLFNNRTGLVQALIDHVAAQVEHLAERAFEQKLRDGEIRFNLQTDSANYRMVDSYEIPVGANDHPFSGGYGKPIEASLFEPIFDKQFDSDLERSFARYLDEKKAVQWWHRVAVRQQNEYYLRGWKPQRVWPDFVALHDTQPSGSTLLIFETKGQHLAGSADTEYKRQLLRVLERHFNGGELVIADGPAKGRFRLIFNDSEFTRALPEGE